MYGRYRGCGKSNEPSIEYEGESGTQDYPGKLWGHKIKSPRFIVFYIDERRFFVE